MPGNNKHNKPRARRAPRRAQVPLFLPKFSTPPNSIPVVRRDVIVRHRISVLYTHDDSSATWSIGDFANGIPGKSGVFKMRVLGVELYIGERPAAYDGFTFEYLAGGGELEREVPEVGSTSLIPRLRCDFPLQAQQVWRMTTDTASLFKTYAKTSTEVTAVLMVELMYSPSQPSRSQQAKAEALE